MTHSATGVWSSMGGMRLVRDNPSTPTAWQPAKENVHLSNLLLPTERFHALSKHRFMSRACSLHVEVNRTIRKHLQYICCFERLLHSQSFFEDVCGKLQNCAKHTKARNYTEFKTHISLDVQSTDIHCVTDLNAPAFRCTESCDPTGKRNTSCSWHQAFGSATYGWMVSGTTESTDVYWCLLWPFRHSNLWCLLKNVHTHEAILAVVQEGKHTRKQQRCEVAENRSVYPRALCPKNIQKLKMVASRRKHKDHKLIEVPLV